MRDHAAVCITHKGACGDTWLSRTSRVSRRRVRGRKSFTNPNMGRSPGLVKARNRQNCRTPHGRPISPPVGPARQHPLVRDMGFPLHAVLSPPPAQSRVAKAVEYPRPGPLAEIAVSHRAQGGQQ